MIIRLFSGHFSSDITWDLIYAALAGMASMWLPSGVGACYPPMSLTSRRLPSQMVKVRVALTREVGREIQCRGAGLLLVEVHVKADGGVEVGRDTGRMEGEKEV